MKNTIKGMKETRVYLDIYVIGIALLLMTGLIAYGIYQHHYSTVVVTSKVERVKPELRSAIKSDDYMVFSQNHK